MSTPGGALAPTTIQGEVLAPSAVVGPQAFPARSFFNTVRDLIHRSGTYHSEDDLRLALESVNDFEKSFTKGDHQHVVAESDRAPLEDVSLRIPPRTGGPVPPASGPQIDYNKLAAALVAAGFGQPPASDPKQEVE